MRILIQRVLRKKETKFFWLSFSQLCSPYSHLPTAFATPTESLPFVCLQSSVHPSKTTNHKPFLHEPTINTPIDNHPWSYLFLLPHRNTLSSAFNRPHHPTFNSPPQNNHISITMTNLHLLHHITIVTPFPPLSPCIRLSLSCLYNTMHHLLTTTTTKL